MNNHLKVTKEKLEKAFIPLRDEDIIRINSFEEYRHFETSLKSILNFCVICQAESRSMALIPCHHLCLCHACWIQFSKVRKELKQCRIYRNPLEGMNKIFF